MSKKVKYISSFSIKTLHAMVNKTMLQMLCRTFPGEVVCYASKSALPHLDTSKCINVKKLYVNADNGKLAVLLRYFLSTIHNIRILLTSKKGDILFYNYNNVFSLSLIDFINRFKKVDIIICCHGEIEFVSLPTKGFQLYKKVMSKLVRTYFNKDNHSPAKNIHFIVLSDIAIKNLAPYVSKEMIERFRSIDHPIVPVSSTKTDSYENKPSCCLKLGTVGILNEHKGSDKYLDLIKIAKRNGINAQFHVIGHIQCDATPFKEEGVIVPIKPEEPLPETEFFNKVQELDFILYFYSSDKYKLTASGALLDAIRFRKPIIALRNEYFQYFFNKFGAVGYLVDSVDEMVNLIAKSENLRNDFNFENIERKLSTDQLQSQFNMIIAPLVR